MDLVFSKLLITRVWITPKDPIQQINDAVIYYSSMLEQIYSDHAYFSRRAILYWIS